MIDYKWMSERNQTAKDAIKYFKAKQLKKFLYSFIYLCKAGFTNEELHNFVDGLVKDEKEEGQILS